jgi:hypothetical protein
MNYQTWLQTYRDRCSGKWHAGPNDGDFFENLIGHLIGVEAWEEMVGNEDSPGVLTDLRFIEAKCRAGLVYGLIRDFYAVRQALPDNEAWFGALNQQAESMAQYSRSLRDYAKGRKLLTADGNIVHCYDLETANRICTLEHEASVSRGFHSQCGRYALTSAWDQYYRLWGLDTGTCLMKHWGGMYPDGVSNDFYRFVGTVLGEIHVYKMRNLE